MRVDLRVILGLLCALGAAAPAVPAPAEQMPGPRTVAKPDLSATAVERRARVQPSVPDSCTELPFVETAPQPVLSATERERGFLLFHRSIVDPVYPNTHPLPEERLRELTAFATPGEFEPLTFSIYPVRDLRNLRVRVSALRSADGEIPASALTVRLVTYWNMGFPRYTSRKTYRRVPELLERATVHSSPAGECQRWWITVHVPDGTAPGLYHGAVTLWDDGYRRAVEIPVAFRVLGFPLRADPAKHFSAYYSPFNRTQYQGRDSMFAARASANEYRAMVEMGLDMFPTFYLAYDTERNKIILRHSDQIQRMRAAGLHGPLPVLGGNVIEVLYRQTTPDGRRAPHWRIDKLPPPEFYRRVTAAFRAFEQERKARGWPEMICCPLDEVDATRAKFGGAVYKAVRAAGLRTYITKDPTAADAQAYRSGVDVWCSQPYSMPYGKIVAQDRFEYWSYPNHNAGEIKDRRVMCKGGRMTYGFGLWRSGYTTLIPWHWAWTPGPDQFDYLRGPRSGCGQRLTDEGEVIPAVYWACFREGRDDERYLYTLQQAAWERTGSADPSCRAQVRQARALLQRTWDDIRVQRRYLAQGMWPGEEFAARRWLMASATRALLRFPATRSGAAPSVWVADTRPRPQADEQAFIDSAIARGQVEIRDLIDDGSAWKNVTGEGRLTVTPQAGVDGRPGLRWQVAVDQKTDGGGEDGYYPMGWPRMYRAFPSDGLDMSRYDYLLFRIRVDSDRDEVADDSTPVGFTIDSNKFYEVGKDLGGQQGVWLPVLFSVPDLVATVGQGVEPWKSIHKVQFFISERQYRDGTHLTFDFSQVGLLRFKQPMVARLEAPAYVLLPHGDLAVRFRIMGERTAAPGRYEVRATLTDAQGRPVVTGRGDLSGTRRLSLDLAQVHPGTYSLAVAVRTAAGRLCSVRKQSLVALAGPLME